jgi:ubiquinone/menaquinone biosynthesis C-methylase UbiE
MKDEEINTSFVFACPICHGPLEEKAPDRLYCLVDAQEFACVDGVWHFLPANRLDFYARFIDDYETIRRAEGRGSDNPAYYQALPFEDITGQHKSAWRIRAASYHTFLKHVLEPLEQDNQRPLILLDLGAGNGWLSYRLSLRGHEVAAVDLITNCFDGLGAHKQYNARFQAVQAEFDRLPMLDGTGDAVIYNASLHYSINYEQTLAEARRILRPDGVVVIIDTPVYQCVNSGRQMVYERQEQFQKVYGRAGNALANENYLTRERLAELAQLQGLIWHEYWSIPAWRRHVRRWRSQLNGRREPAQFPILMAQW